MESLQQAPSCYDAPTPLYAFREPVLTTGANARLTEAVAALPESPSPANAEAPHVASASASQIRPRSVVRPVEPLAKVAIPRPTFEELCERIQSLQLQRRELLNALEPRGGFGLFKRMSNWFQSEETAAKQRQLTRVESALQEATAKLKELQYRRMSQKERFAGHSWKMGLAA